MGAFYYRQEQDEQKNLYCPGINSKAADFGRRGMARSARNVAGVRVRLYKTGEESACYV